MTDRELLQQCYDVLGRYEGIAAARAYTEMTSPPFKRGARNAEWDAVRDTLAALQKRLKCGS